LVQGDHCKVDGLRRPESPDARVADHEEHVDVSLTLYLLPHQMVARAALVASLGGRIMQPRAGGAVLQDQPPLVTGVPEGLGQIIRNRGRSLQTWDRCHRSPLLWHHAHRASPLPTQWSGCVEYSCWSRYAAASRLLGVRAYSSPPTEGSAHWI